MSSCPRQANGERTINRFFRFYVIAATLVAALFFCPDVSAVVVVEREASVLFIGNSLTYWNDLPAIVQAMGKAGKPAKVNVDSVTFPDHSLEDHWNRGDALSAIKKKKWDFVVLQQGPSASATSRASLIRFASMYSAEIRAIGAKPALYSVWPSRPRLQDLEESIRSYGLAAKNAQAMLIPVGTAWRIALQLDADMDLYDPDGLHPSRNGSYLAGLVFYETLFAKSSIGLPSRFLLASGKYIEIDDSIAKVLQKAASASVKPRGADVNRSSRPWYLDSSSRHTIRPFRT